MFFVILCTVTEPPRADTTTNANLLRNISKVLLLRVSIILLVLLLDCSFERRKALR